MVGINLSIEASLLMLVSGLKGEVSIFLIFFMRF
jgi:hypothetical protein